MGSIRAIEGEAIHRLHSGQVVLELQQAIKELLENSLDSGATSVEVKIKDHGLDSIEVIDNGSGIAEEDWPSIGLKHHTSKLPDLSALPYVTTFGFRGEALSSLCALCESVTVVTATKETTPLGAIIKLGKDGRVMDSTGRVARPRGTTITLTGLFTPLPVRRKEFERTAKREYTKALTTLTSYALIPASVSREDGREGVRLKVEAISAGKTGKRNTVIVTDGRGSLRSSVTAVWGPKALENVLDISLELDVGIDRLMAKREGLEGSSQTVKIAGLISSATWGQGRSSADRQFYYINGRPVDLPVVAKSVNEVYKSFNTNQLPVVILDITVPRADEEESVDINVSPDKRSIFLHSEAQLVEALRTALDNFFQPSRSNFMIGGASQKVTMVQSSLFPRRSIQSIVLDDGEEVDETDNQPETGQESSLEDSDKENVPAQDNNDTDGDDEDEPVESISPPAKRSRTSVAETRPEEPPARTVRTISTSRACWSPDRLDKVPRTTSKKEERTNLRKRLEGYASQVSGSRSKVPEVEEDELESEEEEDEVVYVTPAAASRNRQRSAKRDLEEDEPMGSTEQASTRTRLPTKIDQIDRQDVQTSRHSSSSSSRSRRASRSTRTSDEVNPTPTRSPLKDRRIPPNDDTALHNIDDSLSSEEWLEQTNGDIDLATKTPARGTTEFTSGPSRSRTRIPIPLDDQNLSDDDEITYLAVTSDPALGQALRSSTGTSYRDEITSTAANGEITLSFDFDKLRNRHRKRRKLAAEATPARDAYSALTQGGISSAAGIDNRDAASAEEALSRVISKSDFERMEVLGQFNKGFIIARLKRQDEKKGGTDDLFIIDQHASDEKYNFETLQQTTVIKAQTLIKPRPLQLTAGDEIVAVENLEILRSNGFEVQIDEDQVPGRGERIKLSAMPVSKETTFDFKDLEQLLHLLSDGSRPAGQMVRCTKARSMFAMRACRKSVMIGKSLTRNQMVALLRNMGTIDQPWNCPHGRPTMRHLTKLDAGKSDRISSRIDWSSWVPSDS